MPQTVTCPDCRRQYAVKPQLAGKRVKCKCGTRLEFPALDPPRKGPPTERDILEQGDLPTPRSKRPTPNNEPAPYEFEAFDLPPDTSSEAPPASGEPAALAAEDTFPCAGCKTPLPTGTILCTACGYNHRTGDQVKTQVLRGTPPKLPTRAASSSRFAEASKARLLAGRICIILAGLLYLGGTCVGTSLIFALRASGSLPNQPNTKGAPAVSMTIAFLGVGLILAVATTYLLCGLNIRRGGFVSTIIAFVLASLHSLGALAYFIIFLFAVLTDVKATVDPATGQAARAMLWTLVAVQSLVLAALLQLVYYLIRVLREPRD